MMRLTCDFDSLSFLVRFNAGVNACSFLARDKALERKGHRKQGVACRVLRFTRFVHGSVPDAGYLFYNGEVKAEPTGGD